MPRREARRLLRQQPQPDPIATRSGHAHADHADRSASPTSLGRVTTSAAREPVVAGLRSSPRRQSNSSLRILKTDLCRLRVRRP